MRSTGFTATLLLMTAIGQAQTLTTAQARAHDGDTATVCGVISSEHVAAGSRGKPTFIDLDAPFPNQAFTILVWEEDPHSEAQKEERGGTRKDRSSTKGEMGEDEEIAGGA